MEARLLKATIWCVRSTISPESLSLEQRAFWERSGAEPLQTSPVDGSIFFYLVDSHQTARFLVNRDGRVLEARTFTKSLAA